MRTHWNAWQVFSVVFGLAFALALGFYMIVQPVPSDDLETDRSDVVLPAELSVEISEDRAVLRIYDGLYGKGNEVGRILASSLPGYEHKGGIASAQFRHALVHPSRQSVLFSVWYMQAQNIFYDFGIANFDGTDVRMLPDATGMNVGQISFSPSGDYFAYFSSETGGGCQYRRYLYAYHISTETKKFYSLPAVQYGEVGLNEGFGVNQVIGAYYWNGEEEIIFRDDPIYCSSAYQEVPLDSRLYRWLLPQGVVKDVATTYKIYEDPDYNFRFAYPSDFSIEVSHPAPFPLTEIAVHAPYPSFESVTFRVRSHLITTPNDMCGYSDVFIGKKGVKAQSESCGDAGHSGTTYKVELDRDLDLLVYVGTSEGNEPIFSISQATIQAILDSIEIGLGS